VKRAVAGALLALAAGQLPAAPPDFEAVQALHPPSESRLLDRHGALLHERRTDPARRRGQWVALDAISPRLRETVIALEDHRFERHAGVDWLALAAAARDTLRGRARGASTISMQVAAQLDPALRAHARRSWRQKWRQMRAARALETAWPKASILEAYLNLASYRGELQGVDSAARALFGKAPAALDGHEALLMSLLLRSPNARAGRVAQRACALAPRFALDCARLTALAQHALAGPARLPAAASLAPHVAQRLLERGTAHTTSSLDAHLQQFARDSLQRQLRLLAPRHVRDGAVLVVDNATGEVLAYVGNGGELSSARHVDGVRAQRQAGSTLKPFLYQLVIERRLLTAASLLEDSPVNLQTPTGLYVPQNYDRSFRGLVSLRASLAGSLNVPAVRTLMLLGPDTLVERLRTLGFEDLDRDGDYYGYALALGSPEVTLWELVNAYRQLATGSGHTALRLTPVEGPRAGPADSPGNVPPVAAARAAAGFVIGDVLADRDSRSASFGVDNALNLPFWAAVKTGTSKQMRDNWCIGYTTRYTVGVWIGNFDGAPMWEVSGLSGAAPIWADLMRELHADAPPSPPRPPAHVERQRVTFDDSREPARDEWFLRGTATTRIAAHAPARVAPRIAYPGPDSILVVDPDIPAAHQRVYFRMRPPRAGLAWSLNDTPMAADSAWRPRPGRFVLKLVDAAGTELDRVQFTVRGNTPKLASATGEGLGIGGVDQTR